CGMLSRSGPTPHPAFGHPLPAGERACDTVAARISSSPNGSVMSRFAVIACSLFVATSLHAQLPVPRLNSVFPCGGRQGSTIECTVAGGDLDKASTLFFSHPGITAEPVKGNTFRVTVGKDVPVGQYDVRVVTPLGLSNFRAFIVSDWPETVEKEPNNDPE